MLSCCLTFYHRRRPYELHAMARLLAAICTVLSLCIGRSCRLLIYDKKFAILSVKHIISKCYLCISYYKYVPFYATLKHLLS